MKLLIFISFLIFWSLFLLSWLFPALVVEKAVRTEPQPQPKPTTRSKSCNPNTLFYIYDLPPKFNHDILQDCNHLNYHTNMCPYITNHGLGPPLPSTATWFATNQFTSELVFHARLQNHPCRTHSPTLARLFYVPFYGGFHSSSHTKNALILELYHHLIGAPWWQNRHGRDHFMALGRTSWDLMRDVSDLLVFPGLKNMSFLPVERHPWKGANQFAIPYPSYFHPYTLDELTSWQKNVTRSKRPHLFSFVGSTRKGKSKRAMIRNEIVSQCQNSTTCTLLDCSVKGRDRQSICYDPAKVLNVMTRSKFCLHPPGDSYTRRSIFDSFLAGCIPVFFSEHSAYDQYKWYLPLNGSSYSVLIKIENGTKIESVLRTFTKKTVMEIRERLVALLPKVTYMHPNASYTGTNDVIDVALEAIFKMI